MLCEKRVTRHAAITCHTTRCSTLTYHTRHAAALTCHTTLTCHMTRCMYHRRWCAVCGGVATLTGCLGGLHIFYCLLRFSGLGTCAQLTLITKGLRAVLSEIQGTINDGQRRSHARGVYPTQDTSCMGTARVKQTRILGNLGERNVGTKRKCPKQYLTYAENLTIELSEGRESPYNILQ